MYTKHEDILIIPPITMKIPIRKVKDIIHYFSNHTNKNNLGKVKLMKLFYFADFEHVRQYGAPITYDTYIHLEHGPVPTVVKNLVDTLCDDSENALLSDEFVCIKREKIHLISSLFPNHEYTTLTPNEIKTLQLICNRFNDANTAIIEEASHNEAPWSKTTMLEEIPYQLALEDTKTSVSKEELDFLLSI